MKQKMPQKSIIKVTILSIVLLLIFIASIIIIPNEIQRRKIERINLDALGAIVVDRNRGEILYSKDIDKRLSPGSITKIMSMFVVFDHIKSGEISLMDEVVVSQHASSTMASRVGLRQGERMIVDDLIKCILIPSGSDAMLALSEHVAGSEQAFVEMMNAKAAQLGLQNTHFAGCIGIEHKDTYSTARDLAVLILAITTEYPQIYEYTRIPEIDLIREDGSVTNLKNTNDMLNYPGINGLKTGSTPLSGYNLTLTYNKNSKNLVFVVLNCSSLAFRKQDCLQLVDVFGE